MEAILSKLFGESEKARLERENRSLRETTARQAEYIRSKSNQMLLLMGTLPLRADEQDGDVLIETDPIGVVAESFVQILEHERHLNESLREARDEIQAILASVDVGLMVLDSSMIIQFCNRRMLEMFGLQESNVSGVTCCRAICGVDSYPPKCIFESIIENRRPMHQPDFIQNGRHFEVSGVPVKNRFGDVTHVVLSYTDTTERMETEQQLKKMERMYRDLFDNAREITLCIAPDGSFVFVNKAWYRHLGYSSEEMPGLRLWNIISPDNRIKCLEDFSNLQRGVPVDYVETVFLSKNNEEIPVTGQVVCTVSDSPSQACFGMFRVLPTNKRLAAENVQD